MPLGASRPLSPHEVTALWHWTTPEARKERERQEKARAATPRRGGAKTDAAPAKAGADAKPTAGAANRPAERSERNTGHGVQPASPADEFKLEKVRLPREALAGGDVPQRRVIIGGDSSSYFPRRTAESRQQAKSAHARRRRRSAHHRGGDESSKKSKAWPRDKSGTTPGRRRPEQTPRGRSRGVGRMTLPLDEACYADHASVQLGTVVENVSLAVNTYRLRFYAPEIARRILPGQFVMVRLEKGNDPLLARPLALYDTVVDGSGHPIGIDIVYLVVGKLTGGAGPFGPRRSVRGLGSLGQRLCPATGRAFVDGCRRHRPDTVSGPGPLVSSAAPLRPTGADSALRPARDALLRHAQRRLSGGRGRFCPPGGRRRAEHRRRLGRPSWAGDRSGRTDAARIADTARRMLRAGADDARRGSAMCPAWRDVRGFAGDAHGLRPGYLLQLRDARCATSTAPGIIGEPASKAPSSTRRKSSGEAGAKQDAVSPAIHR